ncbi:hypothetical protein IE81DRAFT_156651 [Ceraceosorus guamensis]|uniref:Uncharacterized protein n=1 Tax=Ceraceosorus guamensis TaxID=1522189 RepID=A0A316VWL0_9BASI|nr:hypothetical protein IE81DRAFT_156651 [Ceraceosorus guamensis]PWN41850.1 hypothetical protein IE81DRAFT_156651 [Ceraceosorus guamensis]
MLTAYHVSVSHSPSATSRVVADAVQCSSHHQVLHATSPWCPRRVPTALLASTISDDEFHFAFGAPMADASRVVGLSSKARWIFGKLRQNTRPADRLERLSRTRSTRDSCDALLFDGVDQFQQSRARLSFAIRDRAPQAYAVKTQAVVEMGSEAPSWMHIKGRGLQAGYFALCFAAEHVYWAALRRCESDERPEAWKSFELTEEIEQELLQELDGPLHVILHGSEDEQGALDLEKALLYSKIRCVHCHRPIIWE